VWSSPRPPFAQWDQVKNRTQLDRSGATRLKASPPYQSVGCPARVHLQWREPQRHRSTATVFRHYPAQSGQVWADAVKASCLVDRSGVGLQQISPATACRDSRQANRPLWRAARQCSWQDPLDLRIPSHGGSTSDFMHPARASRRHTRGVYKSRRLHCLLRLALETQRRPSQIVRKNRTGSLRELYPSVEKLA
jgi:hypothetical protein